jgi:putative ABC transport system permease protein
MQEKNLGFNSQSKIILPMRTESAAANHAVLQNELTKLSTVEKTSGVEYVPGSFIWSDFTVHLKGGSLDGGTLVRRNTVEPNFMEVLNIKLIAGRHFTNSYGTANDNKVIITELTAKRLGVEPEAIVGQEIFAGREGEKRSMEVIGVMEDYHQSSLKDDLYPILFQVPENPSDLAHVIVQVQTGNFKTILSSIEAVWKKVNPDTPFEFEFLDQNIKKQYDEDQQTAGVITGFTIIAMIISCMGLYGLSTYMAERRFKEIGVRKVMGASVSQITTMMSGEFVKLVLIAFVISVPLGWYGITKWLEGFAYKTPVTISIFIVAGLSAMVIAILTVSFESIRAASGNPVKALRNE